MKYLIALTLSLSLVGCASAPEKVEPLIPIATPCKTEMPEKPTYRYSPPYDNVFDAVRDLLGDREVALAYEAKLEVSLKSCK